MCIKFLLVFVPRAEVEAEIGIWAVVMLQSVAEQGGFFSDNRFCGSVSRRVSSELLSGVRELPAGGNSNTATGGDNVFCF